MAGTIAVSVALGLIVASIIIKMVADRKKGKTSCGCGNTNCGGCSACGKK